MYEMHAEPTPGQDGLVWHVISKETRTSALCGRLLAPSAPAAPPKGEAAEERYCSSCMTAVGSVVERNLRRPTAT
ncbi:hypothetical protein [Streptomyces sp. Wb2n-11]|uniref:hypothetical protein n=1 Tax=Streptomyces sp. Wb2n-11 TaxID=1030533 RepID=UPI000A9FB98E|nr:hypothetical protein [Streptomyces sp. Wb2n-11]